jgi:hypothetical protein
MVSWAWYQNGNKGDPTMAKGDRVNNSISPTDPSNAFSLVRASYEAFAALASKGKLDADEIKELAGNLRDQLANSRDWLIDNHTTVTRRVSGGSSTRIGLRDRIAEILQDGPCRRAKLLLVLNIKTEDNPTGNLPEHIFVQVLQGMKDYGLVKTVRDEEGSVYSLNKAQSVGE